MSNFTEYTGPKRDEKIYREELKKIIQFIEEMREDMRVGGIYETMYKLKQQIEYSNFTDYDICFYTDLIVETISYLRKDFLSNFEDLIKGFRELYDLGYEEEVVIRNEELRKHPKQKKEKKEEIEVIEKKGVALDI